MASGRILACGNCGHGIQVWDDGNPFYIDTQGEKHYAYHPSAERELCTGNDPSLICLDCGSETRGEARSARCPDCESTRLVDVNDLEGQTCPFCKGGTFQADETRFIVS